MLVRVAEVGGNRTPVELPDGSTVRDALVQAGVPTSGMTYSIGGVQVGTDTVLHHKQTITITSKVKGG
jgi:sulfur carrier protein ThiS